MNREDIDKILTGENNEVLEAHSEIVSIQKDKSTLLYFGQKWLDDNLIGGLNNKMVFLGSRPGGGKTYHASSTINNLLDKDINPCPVRILRLNLEMPTSALLLREVSKVLGKKPSEILNSPYSEEEKPKITKIVSSFMNKRITNVSVALKGEDYRYLVQKFLATVDKEDEEYNTAEIEKLPEVNKISYIPRKTKKVVLCDHIHIYSSKEVIDALLLIGNDLKLSDRNLSLIYYFQFNRDIENMWRESKEKKVNPRNMLPNSTFIYLTDVLQQVADLVVGMVIPQTYELDEFAAVHKERNAHLKEHFCEDNTDSTFARLKGRNRIYYNLLKRRMIDSFDDPVLFCDILDPKYEETANKIYRENKSPITSFTTALPTFNKENTTVTAIPANDKPFLGGTPLPEVAFENISSVFDSPVVKEDVDDSPF